jgi:hypothetical protein
MSEGYTEKRAASDDTRWLGAVVIYWVNQYAVVDDQPGGTRHGEMARGLGGLGREVTVVASDLNLSVRVR